MWLSVELFGGTNKLTLRKRTSINELSVLCKFVSFCFCRIIVGMIVFHLLMTGVLSLKESYVAAGFMLPLPVITILFFLFIQQHCLKPSMYLSINMASGLAEASPHFLQVCLVCYVTCDVLCEVWSVISKVCCVFMCAIHDAWCGMRDAWCVMCDSWYVMRGAWYLHL